MQLINENERTKLVEKIARDVCILEGFDPDMKVCREMPQYINGAQIGPFLIPRDEAIIPAWQLYRNVASITAQLIFEAVTTALIAKVNEKDEKSNPPIPLDVYWSTKNSNFYGRMSRVGMGVEFFNNWFSRRDEFPTEPYK